MSKGSSRKTLLLDSGFPMLSSWIMAFNLIAKPSGNTFLIWGINNRYSTPAYPQENWQAKAVNKVIMNGLKKRLDYVNGKWVEELPHVLWTYRITPRRSTGDTLFSMTYGDEAVIPLKNGFPTLRTSTFTLDGNNELLKKNLDLIEEQRENAMVQLTYYQHKLKQGYDTNVKLRPLALRDLVLRKVLGSTKNPA